MSVCILIPARYASSRLPGKPLLNIGTKTVIQRTYLQALKSLYVVNNLAVYVITDSDFIRENIEKIGGNVLMVAENCLNGTERITIALQKYRDILSKYDVVVNVQGDEPFINPKDIDCAIAAHLKSKHECTTLHYRITDYRQLMDRSIGKMVINGDGYVMYCSRALIPHSKDGKPQEGTNYYGHIGLFVFDSEFLFKLQQYPNTPCQLAEDIEWLKIIEMGGKIMSCEVEENEIGVNTPEDYAYLLEKYGSND